MYSIIFADGPCHTFEDDITGHCKSILAILNHCQSQKQRVTALKVIDIWMGKGHANLRPASIKPVKILRFEAERILIYLVLNGYIKEDFHFTPYNTISYLLPGKSD